MRKIYTLTFLLLFLCKGLSAQTLPDVKNFKISTQSLHQSYPANYGRVYYDFDIKGNYGTNEIKLWLYYNSVSTTNLIALSRWNREGDYDYNWPSYYNRQWWAYNSCDINFTTNAGKKFILVVEFGGNQKTLTYTVPYGDSDGDGFNDNVDNCPNTPGTNNGCPPPASNPDLTFSQGASVIYSDANGFAINTYHQLNSEASSVSMNLVLENVGNATSPATQVEFYLSTDAIWSTADINLNKTLNIPSISANSLYQAANRTVYAYEHYGRQGTWYILARIVGDDANNSNNIVPIKVYFNPNRSQIQPVKSSIASNENFNSTTNTVDLAIYDFSGKQIVNKSNLTIDEKENILSELPKGYFIIKTQETKTVKIRKD